MKDLFGRAVLDYLAGNYTEDIITSTNISEEDILPLPYLFRSYAQMPKLEQKALGLARGKVLDVGCGAGSHSLYLQDEKGLTVKAIDLSEGAIAVCKKRGVANAEVLNVLDETTTFDSILLLMNGTGVFQELDLVPGYLRHLKNLLKPNGQILIDSSDIIYMYNEQDDPKLNQTGYYGELEYYLSYKGECEFPFKMLYMDYELLKSACNAVNLSCELIMKGDHFDYLARIS